MGAVVKEFGLGVASALGVGVTNGELFADECAVAFEEPLD